MAGGGEEIELDRIDVHGDYEEEDNDEDTPLLQTSTSTIYHSVDRTFHHQDPSYVDKATGVEAVMARNKTATEEFKKYYPRYDSDASPYNLMLRNGKIEYAAAKRG